MDETVERVSNLTKKVHADDDLQFLFGKNYQLFIFISNPIILKSMLIRVRYN